MNIVNLEQLLKENMNLTRRTEIELVRECFKPGMQVLEIGGGNGFQARILSSWGCKVTSIDIESALIGQDLYCPVSVYDGQNIPFQEDSFDAVFSSNVLEHIPHCSMILGEISRIIKPNGIIVHILPSSSWRFWTSLTHYVHWARLAVRRLFPHHSANQGSSLQVSFSRRNWGVFIKGLLLSGPHGAYPNEFYELYAFSRSRWLRVFATHGFEITRCFSNGLFYSGHGIFPRLSMERRRDLSRFLGPAAWIYIMRPGMKDFPAQ